MTAQPERVNLERVLRPAMPSAAEGREHARTWRVVREDGSKASLHSEVLPPAKPSSPPVAPPVTAQVVPEPKTADSATITARQRLINLASLSFLGANKAAREPSGIDLSTSSGKSSRAGVGMPKASPQLSSPSSSFNSTNTESAAAGGSGPALFSISATTTSRPAKPRKPADPPTPAEAERDLQLMRVIDAWPSLSLRARDAVVAVVEASCQR